MGYRGINLTVAPLVSSVYHESGFLAICFVGAFRQSFFNSTEIPILNAFYS